VSQRLRLDIDDESFERLAAIAIAERRPIGWQAEVLLLQAIGRWPVPSLPQTPAVDTADVSVSSS
jgi:hypothetical protein